MKTTSQTSANAIRLKLASVILVIDMALKNNRCKWNQNIVADLKETRNSCEKTLKKLEEIV